MTFSALYNFFMQKHYVIIIFLIFCFNSLGCFPKDQPPYITAEVVNVYQESAVVKNFRLNYWWEERGETPFLKPYNYRTKEFIVEVMVPYENNTNRVSLQTERIPLQDITTITVVLTGSGKEIKIFKKDAGHLTATMNFPRSLKKEEKTGLADYTLFVEGYVDSKKEKKEFKLDFNYITQINIIAVSDR